MSDMKMSGFQQAIDDDASLALFMKKIREFDRHFCDQMAKGSDFTLRLEVRGNMKEILHVRVYIDDREQPKGAQKRIDSRVEKEAVARSYA